MPANQAKPGLAQPTARCGRLLAETRQQPISVEAEPSVARGQQRLRATADSGATSQAPRARRTGPGQAPTADTLRQITLVEMLARRLRATIVDENLPPGSRLGTKTELAQQYGVSMGTVHAAVRLLESQGLAEGRPGVGGGVFVSDRQPHLALASILLTLRESSNQASVRDMLEAQASLDVLLARRAAEERRDADVPLLREALAAMEAAGRQVPRVVGEYLRRDWALHDAIAQAGHNGTLLAVYRTILGFIEAQVQDVARRPSTIPAIAESLTVHSGIVASIVDGDPEAATRFAEQHRRRVLPQLEA
jgi:DNA-binding FadR family transcriptional regulator